MNAMKTVIIGLAVALAAVIGYAVYLHQGPNKNITNENQNLLAEIDQLKTSSTDMNSAHKAELDNRNRREKGLETKNIALEETVARVAKEKEMVEIELENLTLRQLVDFLIKVESSDVLAKTKTLYIKPDPTNKDLLDSVVRIHNAKPAQNRIARQ